MDVREKLVELIEQSGACFNCFPVAGYEKDEIEKIALHLIAHGVTVQECGGCDICNAFISNDTLWKFCPFCGNPIKKTANGG